MYVTGCVELEHPRNPVSGRKTVAIASLELSHSLLQIVRHTCIQRLRLIGHDVYEILAVAVLRDCHPFDVAQGGLAPLLAMTNWSVAISRFVTSAATVHLIPGVPTQSQIS